MNSKDKLKKWIRHTVDTELYGNTTRADVAKLVSSVYATILKELNKSTFVYSKAQYKRLIEAIQEVLKEYKIDYTNVLERQIGKISEYESNWVKDFMAELGKDIIIPATIISSIKFSPIALQSNYKELVSSSADRIFRDIDSSLRTSYITKTPVSTIVESIPNLTEKTLRTVDADVETFNTTSFSLTDYLVFKHNKEQVYWSSILDSKTCNECAYRHGQLYSLKEIEPPPLHHHCRCDLVPQSLGPLEYNTYSEWFEDLEEQEKKDVLGPGRYQLYKSGLGIDRFINDGTFISIKSLKDLL